MNDLVAFLRSVAAENDCPCGYTKCSKQRTRAEALAYATSVESAMAMIAGAARSMGIEVRD